MSKKFTIENAGQFSRLETVNGAQLRSSLPLVGSFGYQALIDRTRVSVLDKQWKEARSVFEDRVQTAASGDSALEIDISAPISPEEVLARIEAMVRSKVR